MNKSCECIEFRQNYLVHFPDYIYLHMEID